MGSEARRIDVVVVSATDLKKVKKIGGPQQRCYAVAYIYSSQRQATHADLVGGVNPTWDAPLILTCYETDLYPEGNSESKNGSVNSPSSPSPSSSSTARVLNIDIYARSYGIFGSVDKLVGTVVVPLQYIASAVQVENRTMMSLDVRRPTSGKVQGKLNLTMKLGPKHSIFGDPAAYEQQMPSYSEQILVDSAPLQVQSSAMMPSLVPSYSSASAEPYAVGVYDPDMKSLGKQEVVTGYPAPGFGFAPLGPLPEPGLMKAGTIRPLDQGQGPHGPEMTRRQIRRARRAQRKADPARKAARRKRMKMGAMIAGGLILGIMLL